MSFTDGTWSQGTAVPGLNLFLGADQFTDFAGLATLPATPAAGLLYKVVPSTDACKFFITAEGLLLRSLEYATPAGSQSQFGTAASQPGPSSVANTMGPLGLLPGYPPIPAAQLATLGNVQRGPIPKGMQINSIDLLYQVLAVNASAATVGLTETTFSGASAPTVTNLIALAANGLPTAIQAQVIPTPVLVPTPIMINPLLDTQIILNVNLTAGSGGTINFYGAVLKCSYNFN